MTTDEHYGSYLHTWHEVFSALKLVVNLKKRLFLKKMVHQMRMIQCYEIHWNLRYQLEQVDKSSVPFFETFSQKLNYRQQIFSQEVSMIPIFSYMITEWGEFTPDFEIAWAPWPQNEKGTNYASSQVI